MGRALLRALQREPDNFVHLRIADLGRRGQPSSVPRYLAVDSNGSSLVPRLMARSCQVRPLPSFNVRLTNDSAHRLLVANC